MRIKADTASDFSGKKRKLVSFGFTVVAGQVNPNL
jgi:hypothetical protein